MRTVLLVLLLVLACDPDPVPGGTGDDTAGDTVTPSGFPLDALEPAPPPAPDLTPPPWLKHPEYCGNGIVEAGEACDLAAGNDDHGVCTKACLLPACGDGFTQAGEECDDGDDNTDLGGYGSCTTLCAHGPSYCGDHYVDVDEGEECDHGPMGSDACTVFCKLDGLLAFVSSEAYDGKQVGGLIQADHHCTLLADLAGLPRANLFKAWISDVNVGPVDRLAHVDVPYFRRDGLRIAEDWADLTDGVLENPIAINEFGEPTLKTVWTNTTALGAAASVHECNEWTLNSWLVGGRVGDSSASGPAWTDFGKIDQCSDKNRLYCLEQPQNGG